MRVKIGLVVRGNLNKTMKVLIPGHTMVTEGNGAIALTLHCFVHGIPVRSPIKARPQSLRVINLLAVTASVRLDVIPGELTNVQLSALFQVRVIRGQVRSLL